MNSYSFLLNFNLPSDDLDPQQFLNALYDEGCDDATVGIGSQGMIGLDFTREAESAEDALQSAVRDVQRAIPGAILVQAGPDLVGLTDMAEIFGFSRQNMRKYASRDHGTRFPVPTILGEPSLWHLAEIASWLKRNTGVSPGNEIVEVSKAAARLNWEIEDERRKRILELA